MCRSLEVCRRSLPATSLPLRQQFHRVTARHSSPPCTPFAHTHFPPSLLPDPACRRLYRFPSALSCWIVLMFARVTSCSLARPSPRPVWASRNISIQNPPEFWIETTHWSIGVFWSSGILTPENTLIYCFDVAASSYSMPRPNMEKDWSATLDAAFSSQVPHFNSCNTMVLIDTKW